METKADYILDFESLRTNAETKQIVHELFETIIHLNTSLRETRYWLQQYREKYREQNLKLAVLGHIPTRSLMQEEWDLLEEEELARWQDFCDTYLDGMRG